jgi:hypothetical protein
MYLNLLLFQLAGIQMLHRARYQITHICTYIHRVRICFSLDFYIALARCKLGDHCGYRTYLIDWLIQYRYLVSSVCGTVTIYYGYGSGSDS